MIIAPEAPATHGGRRAGAGRKSRSAVEQLERALSAGVEIDSLVGQAAKALIDRVGMPPRRRLLAGERVKERSDGPWLGEFMAELCVQTIGRFSGVKLITYPEQQAFLNDALAFDDEGARLYGTSLWGIPRKNGKTTTCAGVSNGMASPAEGEGRPFVILAAGSKEQAAPGFDQAVDFARGDELLRAIFIASKAQIECPANGGRIARVAGDGKLNHGLNPYVIIPDELHAWLTPRQRENWNALTTADGAREDAMVIAITTAGYDPTSILAELLAQARQSPFFEEHPEMGGGGFIVRDPVARLLVHWYAVAPNTSLDDLDEWKRANPAPWRTRERIAQDLAKRTIDEGTKRRLYGNEWTSARDVWIKAPTWKGREDADACEVAFEDEATIGSGVDASLNHDTTARGIAAQLDDGRIAVRVKVWSTRPEVAAHEVFDGDRIELAAVEKDIAGSLLEDDFGGDDLAARFNLLGVGFDPRYFNRSAEMLDDAGVTTVKYEPNSRTMWDAIQSFYNLVLQGRIVHDGDPVLAAHIAACAGVKTERGWKLSKIKSTLPIDAVIAVIFAVDMVVNGVDDGVYAGLVEMPA